MNQQNPENKTPEKNTQNVAAERVDYRNRRILGFWHSATSPVFQQVLGPDLSRELDARLETSDPWCLDVENAKKDEAAFICRLDHQCSLVMKVLDILTTLPEDMTVEAAIDEMGKGTNSREARMTLAAFLELSPQRVIDAGMVEFADTIAMIHGDIHSRAGSTTMIVLNLSSLGR